MTIIVTCRRCGHDFEVDRKTVIAGDWQKACPVCGPMTKASTDA